MERTRAKLLNQQYAWGDEPNTRTLKPTVTDVTGPPSPSNTSTNDIAEGDTCRDNPADSTIDSENGMNGTGTPKSWQPAITSRGWTLEGLMESGERFSHVPRVCAISSAEVLEKAIKDHEENGKPLIISDWDKHPFWPKDEFSVEWLLRHGDQRIQVRNCQNWKDQEMSLQEFIEKSRSATPFAEPNETERFYGKDATCPQKWHKWIMEGPIPESLQPHGTNDLLQLPPAEERVETLMCYFGIGDTFTPAHKDLCASSGQNLMCYTEKGGSSFWFMTESSAAPAAASYFQSLHSELDHEQKVVSPAEFAKAPFTVYVAEQKLGDLVLVPKRSCHQVVNHGGLTIKTSWSRMTVAGLVAAYHYELPIYRRVCRRETYRVKSLVHYAILHFAEEARKLKPPDTTTGTTAISANASGSDSTTQGQSNTADVEATRFESESQSNVAHPFPSPPTTPIQASAPSVTLSPSTQPSPEQPKTEDPLVVRDLRALVPLFDKILKEEYAGACMVFTSAHNRPSSMASEQASLACDFCGSDIFQSYFECKKCALPEVAATSGPASSLDTATQLTSAAATDAIHICPGCYVEGRCCSCQDMMPAQCRPINHLFADRNEASALLRHWGTRWHQKQFELGFRVIKQKGIHYPVFEAACILWEERRRLAAKKSSGTGRVKADRQCRHTNGISHPVSLLSALNCKKCHAASCFVHNLKKGIHASEAILEHGSDKTHRRWHDYHIRQKDTFAERKRRVEAAAKTGQAVDVLAIYTLAAAQYPFCHPFSRKTCIGWYDDKYYQELIGLPEEDLSVETTVADQPAKSGSSTNALQIETDSTHPTTPTKRWRPADSVLTSSPLVRNFPRSDDKRKRMLRPKAKMIFDCVEVRTPASLGLPTYQHPSVRSPTITAPIEQPAATAVRGRNVESHGPSSKENPHEVRAPNTISVMGKARGTDDAGKVSNQLPGPSRIPPASGNIGHDVTDLTRGSGFDSHKLPKATVQKPANNPQPRPRVDEPPRTSSFRPAGLSSGSLSSKQVRLPQEAARQVSVTAGSNPTSIKIKTSTGPNLEARPAPPKRNTPDEVSSTTDVDLPPAKRQKPMPNFQKKSSGGYVGKPYHIRQALNEAAHIPQASSSDRAQRSASLATSRSRDPMEAMSTNPSLGQSAITHHRSSEQDRPWDDRMQELLTMLPMLKELTGGKDEAPSQRSPVYDPHTSIVDQQARRIASLEQQVADVTRRLTSSEERQRQDERRYEDGLRAREDHYNEQFRQFNDTIQAIIKLLPTQHQAVVVAMPGFQQDTREVFTSNNHGGRSNNSYGRGRGRSFSNYNSSYSRQPDGYSGSGPRQPFRPPQRQDYGPPAYNTPPTPIFSGMMSYGTGSADRSSPQKLSWDRPAPSVSDRKERYDPQDQLQTRTKETGPNETQRLSPPRSSSISRSQSISREVDKLVPSLVRELSSDSTPPSRFQALTMTPRPAIEAPKSPGSSMEISPAHSTDGNESDDYLMVYHEQTPPRAYRSLPSSARIQEVTDSQPGQAGQLRASTPVSGEINERILHNVKTATMIASLSEGNPWEG